MYLYCPSDCVSEKVNKQPEVINEAEVDCLCGRNWAEDPIQGNSDLWVITCNVLRRRAVSGCLSDSISPTQSSAVHSLCLNCPICFPPDAQLFPQPFPLHLLQQRERITHLWTHSHTQSASLLLTNKYALWTLQPPCIRTQFLFFLCIRHANTNSFVFSANSGLYIFFTNILFCHGALIWADLYCAVCCWWTFNGTVGRQFKVLWTELHFKLNSVLTYVSVTWFW